MAAMSACTARHWDLMRIGMLTKDTAGPCIDRLIRVTVPAQFEKHGLNTQRAAY